jgi:hypothetical protein
MVADYANGVEDWPEIDDEEWGFVELCVDFQKDLV